MPTETKWTMCCLVCNATGGEEMRRHMCRKDAFRPNPWIRDAWKGLFMFRLPNIENATLLDLLNAPMSRAWLAEFFGPQWLVG